MIFQSSQGRIFNVDRMACAFNLDFGLILQCNLPQNGQERSQSEHNQTQSPVFAAKLSPLSLLDMSRVASLIPAVQHKSEVPCEDDDNLDLPPCIVLSTLVVKSNVNSGDSFSSAFCIAFCRMMTTCKTNKARD